MRFHREKFLLIVLAISSYLLSYVTAPNIHRVSFHCYARDSVIREGFPLHKSPGIYMRFTLRGQAKAEAVSKTGQFK